MSRQSKHDQVTFTSEGVELDGWHFTGAGPAFDGPHGRPVVVMAHGLGGTKDSGLEPFATGLAEAGLDVLAFDYRGFGASGGTPRQRVSMAGQLEDYRAAMAAAARLPGVDRSRLVLWGVSAVRRPRARRRGRPRRRRRRGLAGAAGRRVSRRPPRSEAPLAARDAPLDRRRRPQPDLDGSAAESR